MTAATLPVFTNPLTVPSAVAAEVRERVREAASARTPLRIVGGGTWLDAGRPVREDAVQLSMAEHAGIVEYEPGDLTLTAKAGTPLIDIQKMVFPERQWLGLDPFVMNGATIGATVATASSGPLAHAFGTPRDNVLGVEFITGTGEVVRGGGRVVKNVAGFDLTRLTVGAWGTLGVITEVTVRLRARPDVDVTVMLPAPSDRKGLSRLLERLRLAPIAPLSLELLSEPLARAAHLGSSAMIVARLGGNEELVRAQEHAFRALGEVTLSEPPVPGFALFGDADFVAEVGHPLMPVLSARLSGRPSDLVDTWVEAQTIAAHLERPFLRASIGRGVVRLTATDSSEAIREAFLHVPRAERRAPSTLIFERLPAPLWPELAPSPATDRLSRGIRDAFDPHRILNPGILGE